MLKFLYNQSVRFPECEHVQDTIKAMYTRQFLLFFANRCNSDFEKENCEHDLIPIWFIDLSIMPATNYQLLDEVKENIVIFQWPADQLFADAEGRGK